MRPAVVPSLLLAASFAPACCGVGAGGAQVAFTGQTNLVVWDAARGIEHFVRDARFETKGGSLGFIAPTPGKPTLSAINPSVFTTLAALKPDPPALSNTKDDTEATAIPASMVRVVEVKDVGGYHATVLKATDGTALAGWLKANGYASPAFLPRWAAPYVARGWYLTAFRVNGEATGSVRMSFHAERPFNPYAVPKENGSSGATLRLFYVSAGGEVPKIGGTDAWRDAEWTADLPVSTAARIAHDLRLEPGAIPAGARVAEYQDPSFGRPGLDDLYFVPDRAPLVRAGALAVGLGVGALALIRRRRRA